MTVVEEHDRVIRTDLGKHGGDELLPLQLPGHAALQPLPQPHQVGLIVRRLPERPRAPRRPHPSPHLDYAKVPVRKGLSVQPFTQ